MVKQLAWMKGGILARNPGKTKSFWDDPLNSRSPVNKGHRAICGGLLANRAAG